MATKVVQLVCFLLFRLLLPVVLFASAVVRFNALSFIYTIFLLLSPLLPAPSSVSIRRSTGLYLRVVFIVSLLAVIAHAVFHITLTAIATETKPYGHMFPKCSSNERLARQILLEPLKDVPTVDIVRLVLPDLGVFITGLLVYIICFKLLPPEADHSEDLPTTTTVRVKSHSTLDSILTFFGEFLVVIFLAAGGIVVPSAISAFYFLSFILIATIWAFYGQLGSKFAVYRAILLIYCGGHVLLLHLYQFQFFQEAVPPDDFVPRLVGLTAVVMTNCTSPEQIFFKDSSEWPTFVNPAVLLTLFYILAFEVRRHCDRKLKHRQRHPGLKPMSGEDKEKAVAYVNGGEDSSQISRSSRRQKKADERQVAHNLDESQKEDALVVNNDRHLVDAEVRDYSSIEPAASNRSESPTMLGDDSGESRGDEGDEGHQKDDEKRTAITSVLVYVSNQSYVLSLIAMMAWSITFHSWLTFVLLLLACFIWMFPNSRRVCYVLSPIILLYGIGLLVIQFVYGMNLTTDELPDEKSGVKLADIGLKRFPYPCVQLALQVFYAGMFWLTLRQYMRERRQSILAEGEKYQMEPVARSPSAQPTLSEMLNQHPQLDLLDGYDSNTMIWLGQFAWWLLCKYWIILCGSMMLLISLQEVVVYRIIYMILFLLWVLTFQFLYRVWRALMAIFLWVVIIYSMIVLIVLYTYQFDNIAEQWHKSTGLSNETLADIGLESFSTAGLFIRLLTPTSFLIFIIIQFHYFHTPFLQISDLDRYKNEDSTVTSSPATQNTATERTTSETLTESGDPEHSPKKKKRSMRKKASRLIKKVIRKADEIWSSVAWFLWRLAEIHIFKVVCFIIIMVSVYEVTAISAVYMILLSVFLPLTGCQFLLSHISLFWTALVILSKMIFQLRLVDNSRWLSNCTEKANVSVGMDNYTTIDNALWVGLHKTDSIAYYLRNYIGILLIILLERIVTYHQTQYYRAPGVVRPKTGIIFPEVRRKQADEGIISCIKYFLNFFFYKFGLELCYIMTAIVICVRVDVLSVIYAVFLGLLLLLSRNANAIVWPVYTIILVILLPVQFLLSLGVPKGLCYDYPWDDPALFRRELEHWLYLPDFTYPPDALRLVADFFQLLFVCLQWRVFRQERWYRANSEEPDGGYNTDIYPEVIAKVKIPVEDFTTKFTSYLDVIKYIVFVYMFWFTMAMVFFAGTTRINLFSLGYVIAVFCFMWFGQEFLIKPLPKLVRAWNFLIGYCFFVLLLKAAMQLPGCVYITTMVDNACWLVQLLGLTCLRPASTYPYVADKCSVEKDNTGLAWDVICFLFLLLQRRIYKSHYFRHVRADFEAQNRLAARGCQLINRILIKSVAKQKETEAMLLENIKKKMKELQEKQRKQKKTEEPEEHFQAIRSGDYYLFEDTESETELEDEEVTTVTYGTDKEDEDGPNPLKLVTTAITSGTDEAVKQAEEDEDREGGGSKPSSPRSPRPVKTTDEADSETTDDSEEEKGGIFQKIKGVFGFLMAFLGSLAMWLTRVFNGISRNYRLVAAKMRDDHIRVKQQIQSEHVEVVSAQPMELEDRHSDGKAAGGSIADGDEGAAKDTEELMEVTVEPVQSDIDVKQSEMSLYTLDDIDKFDEEEVEFEESQTKVYRLLVAICYAVVARSELVCYFLMILNHILSASLLSLPLPMLVFLWGMLSVPRPTKTFWITVITYAEAVVVVKYLFQFGFFPWNSLVDTTPFWPPRILGIEKKDAFATVDLVLLLALFIHRTILKRYGLWKDEDEEVVAKKEESSSIEEQDDDNKTNKNNSAAMMRLDSQTGSQHLEGGGDGEEGEDDPDNKEQEKKSVIKELLRPFINFYSQLTCPDYSATTDVYAPMFACDFINFLIVVFGYQAFGPSQTAGAGDVTSYLSENRVPVPFLIMLLAQFILIVVDRALYLRKNILGKFIFQILLVILIHLWIFFLLPYITNTPFVQNKPAQLWYFIKCVYFALSAYQIRSAYPTRILGNFLTKKYNYLNLILFKIFLAIPFLLELRTLMDWTWTSSTLALGSWLQMEDIYAHIYVLKCGRDIEKNHPTPRGVAKSAVVKYGVGGLLLFIVIFIIWFPLVIFSFANTVYVANPPREVQISVGLAGYQPLFMASGQQQNFRLLTNSEFQEIKSHYDKDVAATGFLSNYEPGDISLLQMDGKSTSLWGISPPSLKQLGSDLLNDSIEIRMEFHISFSREPNAQAGETLSQQYVKKLTKDEKMATSAMINGSLSAKVPVNITGVFPMFIRLGTKEASPVDVLLGKTVKYSDISILLKRDNDSLWWEIKDKRYTMLTITTFNDRVAPAGFSLITGYGIMGLYVTFILLIGRLLRGGFSGMMPMITYRELPYVDKILKLCLDVYLVREMQEYRLEEDLFAKLLFVFSILGLYVSLVLVIGRLVRGFISGQAQAIMFEELPQVDKILRTCLNLYMARECGEWRLEEDLFSKLLFIYRSPETMIKWTKYKID